MTAVTKELKTDIRCLWKCHVITFIALSLSQRSSCTLKLLCGWVGCAFLDCLGKCQRRKLRWGWHWSSFYTDKYCMTHSLATGRVGVWVCTRLRFLRRAVSDDSLFTHSAYLHPRLTWFVAQYIQFALRCLFLIISSVSPWAFACFIVCVNWLGSFLFHFQSQVGNASLVATQNKTEINVCKK